MATAFISEVARGSVAAEAHIKPGEELISINGLMINDVLDYQFACTDDRLDLLIRDKQGKERLVTVSKDLDTDVGLVFDEAVFDGMMMCQNRCQFCFVDQMPRRLRRSLYLKDDDYRYSFLFGSFVTMGNLREQDWAKIKNYHLSPLYISVHATDIEIRQLLVRPRKQPDIMADLRRLAAMEINMHTQIVLCPGINDGAVLDRTINDLSTLIPWVRSVGIVPVGLTGFRQRLPNIKPVDSETARSIISKGEFWQQQFRKITDDNTGFVYLADEFFIKAELPLPEAGYYDGYPQIENGIGLGQLFLSEWEEVAANLPAVITSSQGFIIVCGLSAVPILTPVVDRLNQIGNLQVNLLPVENRFFGGQVTVTGLLTGQDIIASLKECTMPGVVLLPRILLKEGENKLLDEVTVQDIEEATGLNVKVVETKPADLVQAMNISVKKSRPKIALRRNLSY